MALNLSTIAFAVGLLRGSGPKVNSVPSAAGPVIDATAGFGADAAVLALASDREVLACESHPVMAAILEDGIGRARRAGLPGVRI